MIRLLLAVALACTLYIGIGIPVVDAAPDEQLVVPVATHWVSTPFGVATQTSYTVAPAPAFSYAPALLPATWWTLATTNASLVAVQTPYGLQYQTVVYWLR
jgi:hypothetical protein